MRKKYFGLLLAVLLLLTATGCGSKSAASSSASYGNEASMSTSYYEDSYEDEAKAEESGEGVTSETGLDAQTASGRKLIRTVYLSLQTTEFDSVLSNLASKTTELGGYIENSSVSGNSYYYQSTRYASYTIRIPSAKLDQFVEVVKELGNVTHKNESVEDVTLRYVDVESRKKALETEQERLMPKIWKTFWLLKISSPKYGMSWRITEVSSVCLIIRLITVL